MKESIETLRLVLWFDMTLDRTKSERFQHSVCMLSASCIYAWSMKGNLLLKTYIPFVSSTIWPQRGYTWPSLANVLLALVFILPLHLPGCGLALPVYRLYHNVATAVFLWFHLLVCMSLCDAKGVTQDKIQKCSWMAVFKCQRGISQSIKGQCVFDGTQTIILCFTNDLPRIFVVSFIVRNITGGHASVHVQLDLIITPLDSCCRGCYVITFASIICGEGACTTHPSHRHVASYPLTLVFIAFFHCQFLDDDSGSAPL